MGSSGAVGRGTPRRWLAALGAAVLVGVGASGVLACDSGPAPSAATTTIPGPATSPAATAAAACRGTGYSVSEDVRYRSAAGVDPNLLSLDLYRPTRPAGCGPAPIVVYVHGGGFRIGDKANAITDKARLFTSEGWVLASVNYRLSTTPAVRYPTHEEDVAAAIAWLRSHAASFGGDPTRIVLVGHSSGAFLVSLLSTDTAFLSAAGIPLASVRCTVSLDTEYDVAAQVAQGGAQEDLYRHAFGDDADTWRAGSPVEHTAAGADRPRFLVYTRGADRRVAQAQAFGSALRRGGTSAEVLDVRPLSHAGVNAAVGAPGDTTVTGPLLDFLRSCT